VLAMVRAMGSAGAFNIDTLRFYRETLPPHVYLGSCYYRKWLLGLEDLLIDKVSTYLPKSGTEIGVHGGSQEAAVPIFAHPL
jgi:nitrile hydratase subunit beta